MMKAPSKVKPMIKQVLSQNEDWFIAGTTGSAHLKLEHRITGATVVCSQTPSDQYAVKKIEGDMRRAIQRKQGIRQ